VFYTATAIALRLMHTCIKLDMTFSGEHNMETSYVLYLLFSELNI
jgi:hypothetical protein